MRLTHQTALATLIQFITLSFLGMANGVNSVVATCRHDGGNCVSNLMVSIIFFILTVLWFGMIWLLGYTAQARRSPLLAWLLIALEIGIIMVAYHNAKHYTDALSLATSLIDLLLALWVITLAFRLARSGGQRITANNRGRRRRHTKPTPEL